jgi:S1-C subfamily serine protease
MGDIILEVDGKSVSTSNELQSIIVTKKPVMWSTLQSGGRTEY